MHYAPDATKNNETAAVGSVACWWMTGEYTGCNSGFTSDYVQKVVNFYQQRLKQVSLSSEGTLNGELEPVKPTLKSVGLKKRTPFFSRLR